MSQLHIWVLLLFFALLALFAMNILLLIGYQIFLSFRRRFPPGTRP